jgi:hypothetical protein
MPYRVTRDDVSGLVGHDTGELGLVVRGEEESRIDVEVTPGRGERIHRLRVIDDVDLPLHLRTIPLAEGDDLVGHAADVVHDDGVVVVDDVLLGLELLLELKAELALVLGRDDGLGDFGLDGAKSGRRAAGARERSA